MSFNSKSRYGFTLLEVVVSLFLLGLIVVSIVPVFAKSFQKLNQATEIVNNDYSAQDVIAKIKLDTSYADPGSEEAKKLKFEVKKEYLYYHLDRDKNEIVYLPITDDTKRLADDNDYSTCLKVSLFDKSSGSLFLTRYIRQKQVTLPVYVLDTTKDLMGEGIEGVNLGLYRSFIDKDSDDKIKHELVQLKTTDKDGKVFFNIPGDYLSNRYVVMFPDKSQYRAFYEYGELGDKNSRVKWTIDGKKWNYKYAYRDDMNLKIGDISNLVKRGTNNLWRNHDSVHIVNRDSKNNGSIICEAINVNKCVYVFDSDTLIGSRGDSRRNFDDGKSDFAGLVNIIDSKAAEIKYMVRKPVNLEIGALEIDVEVPIDQFWITNLDQKDGSKVHGTIHLPLVWPRLRAHSEAYYHANINFHSNDRYQRTDRHSIYTKKMIFEYHKDIDGYSFSVESGHKALDDGELFQDSDSDTNVASDEDINYYWGKYNSFNSKKYKSVYWKINNSSNSYDNIWNLKD